jgi:hypothetical protein
MTKPLHTLCLIFGFASIVVGVIVFLAGINRSVAALTFQEGCGLFLLVLARRIRT